MSSLERRLIRDRNRQSVIPMLRALLNAICAHYHIPHRTMLSRNRTQRVAWARLMFCAVAREATTAFDYEIGGIINRQRDIVNYAESEVRFRAKPSELETIMEVARQSLTQPNSLAA
jgi:chromosomal replication initiation ATPase DnaA